MNKIRNISVALMLGIASLSMSAYAKHIADVELPGDEMIVSNEEESMSSSDEDRFERVVDASKSSVKSISGSK